MMIGRLLGAVVAVWALAGAAWADQLGATGVSGGGGSGSAGCTANASPPTYVEASSDALSCDLSGNTRVLVMNPAGPLVDGNSVAVEISGAATTLLVAAASSQTPRIVAYHIESDAAGGTYKFVQGTHNAADCDTAVTALTGVIPADNSAHPGSTHGDGTGTLIKASTTNVQICIVTTGGGVGFHGFVTYWRS